MKVLAMEQCGQINGAGSPGLYDLEDMDISVSTSNLLCALGICALSASYLWYIF